MSIFTRREFLGTAAAGGALAATHLAAQGVLAADEKPLPKLPPAKIYKVFAGRTGDAYLTRPTEELARFDKYFADLEKKLGDVKFVGGDLVPPADVGQVAAKLKDADALLIIHLAGHGGDAPVLSKLVDVGLPTALFSQPFSGHGWMYFPQWHKQGKKVALLPSSDWKDLDRIVGLLRAPAKMRHTKILAMGKPAGTAAACNPVTTACSRFSRTRLPIPNMARLVTALWSPWSSTRGLPFRGCSNRVFGGLMRGNSCRLVCTVNSGARTSNSGLASFGAMPWGQSFMRSSVFCSGAFGEGAGVDSGMTCSAIGFLREIGRAHV